MTSGFGSQQRVKTPHPNISRSSRLPFQNRTGKTNLPEWRDRGSPPGLCVDQNIDDLAVRPGRAAQPPEYFEVAAYLVHLSGRDTRLVRELLVIQTWRASQVSITRWVFVAIREPTERRPSDEDQIEEACGKSEMSPRTERSLGSGDRDLGGPPRRSGAT